jgi:uncharacterized protein YbjT (DUF2867 family)
MHVLVTGASGFVGSQLVPRLYGDGHTVRALGRDPQRVASALSATRDRRQDAEPADVEIVRAEMLSGSGLERALDGIQLAYYLVHSMESAPGERSPFAERERIAAERFAAAAAAAGVRRIVYLGGLVPHWDASGARHRGAGAKGPGSRHLASRQQVERILLSAVPDSVALRASIIIGARSRSFRLLVRLIERIPVLALPAWCRHRTQPIDARDVTAMLAACASADVAGRSLDIGGPEVLSYGEMLGVIAERMLVNRPPLKLGVNLTAITARLAAAIAEEDPALVIPLMEGLQGDLLPREDHAAELLGVRLHSFAAAVEHALAEWELLEPLAAR